MHPNALGSNSNTTDWKGQTNGEQNYAPWGQQLVSGGQAIRFAGMSHRDQTGFDVTPARDYSSTLDRWLTPDPGNAGSDVSDPQTWNAYPYVRNNPTTLTDPEGLDCVYLSGGGSITAIDQRISQSGCSKNGGYYVEGTVTDLSIENGNYVLTSLEESNTNDLTQITTTYRAPSDSVPPEFDPFDIAYLVGGGVGLLRSAVGLGEDLFEEGAGSLFRRLLTEEAGSAGSAGKQAAVDANKLFHIFGNAEHNLGALVGTYGSKEAAYNALIQATEKTVASKGLTGVFETTVQVGSDTITVRGAVVNGVVKIGTAFK